jgi:uncharacterized small protein (DUF1192 family)
MSDEWLTYAQAAERLKMTVEAVRLRALRGHWQKTFGNDKRPRIRLPEGWSNDDRTTVERRERKPRNDVRTTVERTVDPALVHALEGHIATLKADIERLEAQLRIEADRLSESEAQAKKQSAEFSADLAAEKARTEKAIEAFSALADRLDALAAERAKPWWKRLVG